jgi:hypothetical protein
MQSSAGGASGTSAGTSIRLAGASFDDEYEGLAAATSVASSSIPTKGVPIAVMRDCGSRPTEARTIPP